MGTVVLGLDVVWILLEDNTNIFRNWVKTKLSITIVKVLTIEWLALSQFNGRLCLQSTRSTYEIDTKQQGQLDRNSQH